MGTFLIIVGVISVIVGIFAFLTILGAVAGISFIINGIALCALGSTYDMVRGLKKDVDNWIDDKKHCFMSLDKEHDLILKKLENSPTPSVLKEERNQAQLTDINQPPQV